MDDHQGQQELVPCPGEEEYDQGHDGRRGHRDKDFGQDRPGGRSVDFGRLDQRSGELLQGTAEKERAEGDAHPDLGEDEAAECVQQSELQQMVVELDDDHLHGDRHAQEDEAEDHLLGPYPEVGEGVGVGDGEGDGPRHDGNHHDDAVQIVGGEVALDPRLLDVGELNGRRQAEDIGDQITLALERCAPASSPLQWRLGNGKSQLFHQRLVVKEAHNLSGGGDAVIIPVVPHRLEGGVGGVGIPVVLPGHIIGRNQEPGLRHGTGVHLPLVDLYDVRPWIRFKG